MNTKNILDHRYSRKSHRTKCGRALKIKKWNRYREHQQINKNIE